jgi:hypothetical protein|tara:strand:- start:18400 stop:18510 length:111 start_codon:yes stop_codon:yes gene_type:complete
MSNHEHGNQDYRKNSLSLWGSASLGIGVMTESKKQD